MKIYPLPTQVSLDYDDTVLVLDDKTAIPMKDYRLFKSKGGLVCLEVNTDADVIKLYEFDSGRIVCKYTNSDLMKEYEVTWKINVAALNSKDAAEKALEIQRDSRSIATVFETLDECGVSKTIDLS